MSAQKVAIFRIGYQHFAIPAERIGAVVEMLSHMQRMDSEYTAADGYVYWPAASSEDEQDLKLVPASKIKACKPSAPQQPAPAVKPDPAPDARIVAAPSAEPIFIKSVPPTREFVDEFRHGDEVSA